MKNQIIKLVILLLIAVIVYQFGVKPMLSHDLYIQSNKNDNAWAYDKLAKEKDRYDVIVFGEEPDGIAAAVSSSRTGAKTLLLSQGEDLGGTMCKGLYFDMEANTGAKGEQLNKGLFFEISGYLGNRITIPKYKSTMKSMVEDEKNLDVIYGVKLDSPILEGNVLTGISTIIDGKKTLYRGKRFIDATKNGELLNLCGVPYTVGGEDINLKKDFQPFKLNFILSGVEWEDTDTAKIDKIYSIVKDFKPLYSNVKLGSFKIFPQSNKEVIVQGIEVFGIDAMDRKAVSDAYRSAVEEAKRLAGFLKDRLIAFQGSSFEKAAEGFYIKETVHFKGEHVLSVNEVLENTDFNDKIALASNAVEIGIHNEDYEKYIVGKPYQYSIPAGCLIPLKVDNLLMTGGKISYSSLASSSAGSISTDITVGESAGVAAVYSIVKNITPRQLAEGKDVEAVNEFERLLRRQGVYLPEFKLENVNAANWSYPSVKQLNTLGVITAGYKNDYKFDKEATQNDLAILLLNGIFRLSRDKYSLELDARVRPYFVEKGLTKDKAAEILLALNGMTAGGAGAYQKACDMGYINTPMRLRLEKQKILTMDQVYELSAYNIALFTGKHLQD